LRIGVFWLIKPDLILNDAVEAIDKKSTKIKYYFFALAKFKKIEKLNLLTKKYEYESINYLENIFNTSYKLNLNYAVISFGRGIPSSDDALFNLLDSNDLKKCVWSFRITNISGVGMKNPPRLPYVDDHFIILNVSNAFNKKFFSRKIINASHYSDIGFVSSELTSMIEYSLEHEEINNHFFELASLDEFGEKSNLNPLPFNLCVKTGFISAYPEFNKKLLKLLKLNLQIDSKKFILNNFIEKSGFYFFKKNKISFKSLIKILRIILPSEEKLHPPKKYR